MELNLPAEHHVFHHAFGLGVIGLGFTLLVPAGWGLDTNQTDALARIQHDRIAIDHAHDSAAFTRLEFVQGAGSAARSEDEDHP